MELVEPVHAQNDKVCVSRKALEAVLRQCQSALQQLATGDTDNDNVEVSGEVGTPQDSTDKCATTSCDTDTAKFYGLLKSRFECDDNCYLHALDAEEIRLWEMVSEKDLWEGNHVKFETEDYVVVQQEDIMEGIASFMAAYLLSLERTKDLTPNQLQEVLSKTFSGKKKKSKLRKAWDGSRVIYNVASWGATAIGIYQNPALVNAASAAFWTSCRAMSKLL